MQLVERFQTAPFEEIAAHCGARVSVQSVRGRGDDVPDSCVCVLPDVSAPV